MLLSSKFLDFLPNLASEAAAALIMAVLIFSLQYAWRQGHYRTFRRFWGEKARDDKERFCVVTGVYADPRPQNQNRYIKQLAAGPTVQLVGGREVGSQAEARAAGYVAAEIGRYRGPTIEIDTDERLVRSWNGTFICLGSGDSNEKTRDTLNLKENVFCSFAGGGILARWDKTFHQIQRQPPRDKGIILKIPNPHSVGHSLVVCAGLAEPGTAGAAYYLARSWPQLLKRYGSGPFCIVVEVDWNSEQTARPVSFSEAPLSASDEVLNVLVMPLILLMRLVLRRGRTSEEP